MPRLPEPLVVRDWRQVARDYYGFVLDPDRVAVLAATPSGGKAEREGTRLKVDGVVVIYQVGQ
jgi:hypothetical protein